jgi:hypothetical protein
MKIRERWGDYDAPLRSHRGRMGLSRMYCIIHSMHYTAMHWPNTNSRFIFSSRVLQIDCLRGLKRLSGNE